MPDLSNSAAAKKYGFPKQSRVRKRWEFEQVKSAQTTVKGRAILLSWGSRRRKIDHCGPRLGITVTKKINKLAVERNRFKRVVRENFRQYQFPDTHRTYDLVVIALRGATELSRVELNRDVLRVFERFSKLEPIKLTLSSSRNLRR